MSVIQPRITVQEAMPTVLGAVPAASQGTYGTGLRVLVERLGEREVRSVTKLELCTIRDQVQRASGQRTVDRALRRGRVLASFDPRAHGAGAAESFVMACRFFFRYAADAGWLTRSPAADVAVPPRHPSLRRPLTGDELSLIWQLATTTGRDRQLDGQLLRFLRHTAARRSGCLQLRRGHLDPRRQVVLLTEKYQNCRALPLRADIATDLLAFAASRGATRAQDEVFRYRDSTPLTRRRFNSLFDRIDRHCDFTEPLDVSAHWIRHTTLSDIAAVSDVRVAAAYAGHSPASLGVIGRYTRVTFDDLRDAYTAVFGA